MGQLAPILLGVGAGISAIGSLREGKAKERAFNKRADISERNAQLAIEAGEADVLTLRKNIYKLAGAQKAANAASGFAAEDILDIIAETNTEGALDIERRRRDAVIEADSYRLQAALDREYGDQAKEAGRFGAFAALTRGIGGIASIT